MKSIPERTSATLDAMDRSYHTARSAGASDEVAWRIASQQLAIAFTEFQDELLDSQRETNEALASALNMRDGK